MKLFPLVLRNALRNKRRTILTIGSLMAALFICVFLRTILTTWADSSDVPEGARRLIVRNKVSLANVVPLAWANVIRDDPNLKGSVELVHPYSWVGGVVKDHEKDFFQQFACDDDSFFDMWSEVKVDPEVKTAWKEQRDGALVGRKTLEKFGWKVGTRFTLIGTIYPCNCDLTVIGTYSGYADDESVFFHFKTFNESLRKANPVMADYCGTIYLRVKDTSLIPSVIKSIDENPRLANSDFPTLTMTEKDFIQSFVSMAGNVKGFFTSLALAVLAAMLLIIVNTMAMAVRERTREIAVMKALGFTPATMVGLVVSESLLTCVVGGVLGCVGARILFDNVLHRPSIGDIFPNFCPSWETVGIGIGVAAAMGLISGIIPAFRAARLEVVAGLRRMG